MADEDEIDVLGDFNLGTLLSRNDSMGYESASLITQNGDLLNCDYTIHPQWLLDKPSADPDNWYNMSSISERPEQDSMGHVSTENSITDESGWTEKEKNLLIRGIEIFGKSNIRLAQFIGSRTPAEVKYYLKNFYLEYHGDLGLKEGCADGIVQMGLMADILEDNQIPASIEEVIAAVSTAKPTVSPNQKSRKKLSSDSTRSPSLENLKHSPKSPAKFKVKTRLKFVDKVNNKVKKKVIPVVNNNSIEFGKAEITTGKGLAVPICKGEQIIKLKKIEEDSDTDVDIEDSDEDSQVTLKSLPQYTPNTNEIVSELNPEVKARPQDDSTLKLLNNLDVPESELILPTHSVTDMEKAFHGDFFRGNITKTPARYLKIRNHILKIWYSQRPTYLKKTPSRYGLKNCGDVNSFGRIHYFLEQIGAINFGCEEVVYTRPLPILFQTKADSKEKKYVFEGKIDIKFGDVRSRQRFKKKLAHDGEGGCTLVHDERGKVINRLIVNEEPTPKQRIGLKKPGIQLIYCRPFFPQKPQPYLIKILLSTILIMDFHAHLSLTEVMGLLAGYWIQESSSLIITHYEPTLNMASSAVHCDMCPISQAKAADIIHEQELDILGWFHSHPTFAPEPSHQDLETQSNVQQWIGSKNPCIGMIMCPFNINGALIASSFRCMMVDKKANVNEQMVPYKFEVEIVSDGFNLDTFLEELKRLMGFNVGCGKIEMGKPYFLDSTMTYLEKYLTSVRMHLAKCGSFNGTLREKVIQSITQIVESEKVQEKC